MTAAITPVLIVGAGPTGLMLACELARAGVAFRLIEAAPGPQPGSRGKGVQPRTLEAFDDLGVVDRILANGRMAMPVRITAPDGRVVEPDPVTFRGRPDIPYAASVVTPEWRVEETLRGRLSELGGAVEFGAALETFSQDDDAVTATVVRGGVRETIVARWLVGADGGHSTVRKGAGIAFEGETLEDVRMLVADVHLEGLDRDRWHMWRHPEGMVTLCPLPSTDAFQFQSSLVPGQDPSLGLANLQAVLEARSGRRDIRITDATWTSLWRANIRLAEHYRVGRVLIAGDAAHIHSPAGGQGMNTGVQDAHNLGWKLAAIERGARVDLVDTYEAERRPVALGVLALSNERLRQMIGTGTIPVTADANTMQLTVGYRGSTLAVDDRDEGAAVRAGDRMPDAPGLRTVDGERRLLDLTRGGAFALLRFGSAPEVPVPGLRAFHVVESAVQPGDVVDTAGHLAAAFDVHDGALVLLRPDGYVGVLSDAGDPDAVVDYLSATAA
jgi:2-polyprenyl-6-methoxyphenol hydroxylase-like FAD-dependent oxidoreductase